MVDLPKASKVPILTDTNVVDVAKAYLGQLVNRTVKDAQDAVAFVTRALSHNIEKKADAKMMSDLFSEQRDGVLKFTPHVRAEKPLKGTYEEVKAWLDRYEMEHYTYWDTTTTVTARVWVFRTVDDAILFRMKWL